MTLDDLQTLDDVALRPLEPAYVHVLRAQAALFAAVPLAAAIAGDIAVQARGGPPGLAVGPVLLWAAWLVGFAPSRRWRRRGFAFTGRELHVAHGWWTRVHTVVPVRRVQHVDLTQGPIERRHGLATLVLHTAGSEHSRVAAPGLAREEAEAIRDAIRGAIEDGAR